MRKVFGICLILTLGLMICGCSLTGKEQTRLDQERALKFLKGIQQGDKKLMYEAANLAEGLVGESREKLIHQKQHNLTEEQRLGFEHILRTSGQIDFFLARTRPMFPETAGIQLRETKAEGSFFGGRHPVHLIGITYANKTEAMRDKTGKPVKEMVVRLQQLTRRVGGNQVYGFSFDSKDFDKIAARDFEVSAYF